MQSSIGGLLLFLIATAGQFLPQSTLKQPPPVPPETIPARDGSRVVGDPKSSPALLKLDQQMESYGVDGRFVRSVQHTDGLGERLQETDDLAPRYGFAVVNYRMRYEDELGNGYTVWISKRTGETLIVPNAVIRAADHVVVRAGIDLTLLSRVAERAGKRIHVKYHYRGADDGEFMVKVEPHTAKADQKIYWWDGAIGRAHYP